MDAPDRFKRSPRGFYSCWPETRQGLFQQHRPTGEILSRAPVVHFCAPKQNIGRMPACATPGWRPRRLRVYPVTLCVDAWVAAPRGLPGLVQIAVGNVPARREVALDQAEHLDGQSKYIADAAFSLDDM